MFFGLLAFGLVRGVVIFGLRPNYEPPLAAPFTMPAVFPTYGVSTSDVPDDAWVLGGDAVDDQGRLVSKDRVLEVLNEYSHAGCPAGQSCDSVSYLASRGVHQRLLYQPADRYWRFQVTEAVIFLSLGVVFAGGTLLLIKRRDA
jgi:hypothetical protein